MGIIDGAAKVATGFGLVGRHNAATMVMDWLNLLKILGFYQQRWLTPKMGEDGKTQGVDPSGHLLYETTHKNERVGLGFSLLGSALQEGLGKWGKSSVLLDGWGSETKKDLILAKIREARDLNIGEGGPLQEGSAVDGAATGAKTGFIGGMFALVQRVFTVNYRTSFKETHRLMGEALCLSLVLAAVAALYRGSKGLRMELEPLDEDPVRIAEMKNHLRDEVRSGKMTFDDAEKLLADNHRLMKYDVTRRAQLPEGNPMRLNPEHAEKLLSALKRKSAVNWVGMVCEIATANVQRLISAGEIRRYITKDYRDAKFPAPIEAALNLFLPSPLKSAVVGATVTA